MEENIRYKRPMLNFAEYGARRTFSPFPDVPWHWHRDFELSRIKNGSVIYRSLTKEVTLEPGDAIFINSKTIHSITPIEPREEIYHISQFFNNTFIAGWEGSLIDTKYIIPFQQREDVDIIVIRKNDAHLQRVHQLMDDNSELLRKAPKYYEFQLKKNIFDIWQLICESIESDTGEISIPAQSNKRLRHAIVYLQNNYKEKVGLEELSDVVHISPRECNRMFNKYLKISPIAYLQAIRLQKATAMLSDFNKSIGEVALENGYSSSSYFTEIFKKQYNMTPKEYRRVVDNN